MADIAVVLNAHENSPVFRDTLDSVLHHWTDRVLVVADAKGWPQFESSEVPAMTLEGFHHGKASAPFRNVCLGLMKAWEQWGCDADWYCYMEYDCLVGSADIKARLDAARKSGVWILGNDHRMDARSIPFLERFEGAALELHYLLGCCVFLGAEFMGKLHELGFFSRFLNHTNFYLDAPFLVAPYGKREEVYDISEFLYPTLCARYGGKISELACWCDGFWRGDGERYPMRFRPDLNEGLFNGACVMHPIKSVESPIRDFHRRTRSTVGSPVVDTSLEPR